MKDVIIKIWIMVCLLPGLLTGCIEDENVPVDIVTNANIPQLSAVTLKAKTASTITVESELLNMNGYPVTELGICWGTSSPPDIVNFSSKLFTATDNEKIILTIDNLQGSTTYYFRSFATNKAGTGYGDELSEITNDGLGIVHTFIIQDSTHAKTALAGGIIVDPGEGQIKERGIYYALSRNMADKDSVISKMETETFECNLANLKPLTKYYVQAYVRNTYGSFTGIIDSLTTGSGLPVVSDISIMNIESNKADAEAEVIGIGDAPIIQRGFCWSRNPNPPLSIYTNDTLLVTIDGDGAGNMKRVIQPLQANQDYYISAFAENEFGVTLSTPLHFKTTSDRPTLSTSPPEIENDGSVIVRGTVTHIGASDVEAVGICYSTSNPTISGPKMEIILSPPVSFTDIPYEFSCKITGLKGGVTYYFRAYATNGNGTDYGETVNLRTPDIFTLESGAFDGGLRVEGSSSFFTIGDKGYLLGGDIGTTLINNLYSYNPLASNQRWSQFTPYPAGSMRWLSTAVYNTDVYVLGGMGLGSVVNDDFYVYYTVGNIWAPRTTGPPPAYSRAGFALNNEVVYVGGMKDTANNEVWGYNVNTNIWTQKADFPVNQYGGIALNIANTIYAGLGKNTAGVDNKQLWKSSGGLTYWTPEPVASGLYGNILAGVVLNGKIYVIDKPTSTKYILFEYNPDNQTWRQMSELPGNYGWEISFMFTIRNRIYIGFANTDMVVSYNPLWDN